MIDLTEDPDVLTPLRFLREREVVHFQRFGESLDIARDYLDQAHHFFMPKAALNGTNNKTASTTYMPKSGEKVQQVNVTEIKEVPQPTCYDIKKK